MARLIAACIIFLGFMGPVAKADDSKFPSSNASTWVRLSGSGIGVSPQPRYLNMYFPSQYDKAKLYPAIIVLHGEFSSDVEINDLTRFSQLGEKEGFITAVINGEPEKRFERVYNWNAKTCCGSAKNKDVNDIINLDILIDVLITSYRADPKRIYMVGDSNGGAMAYRYACARPRMITAMAVNGGFGDFSDCPKFESVPPVLHIHGTADACYPLEGGEVCNSCAATLMQDKSVTYKCSSVSDGLQKLATRHGCQTAPHEVLRHGSLSCKEWSQCSGGSNVTLCEVANGGHTWPNKEGRILSCNKGLLKTCGAYQSALGVTNTEFDATSFIWDYLKQYSSPVPIEVN